MLIFMFFDEIIHGTQYYRSPTPLPEEWEGDIQNLKDYNLDAMQIRINWRNNETKEGEYEFYINDINYNHADDISKVVSNKIITYDLIKDLKD